MLAGCGVWIAKYRLNSDRVERLFQIQVLAMAMGSTAFWLWDEVGDSTWVYLAALAISIGTLAWLGGWIAPLLTGALSPTMAKVRKVCRQLRGK